MSDPTPHRPTTATGPESRPDHASSPRRTGASGLLWLLLLLVVIATAWYFLGRQDDRALPPAAIPIGDTVPEASQSPVSTPTDSRETIARERAAPVLPDREARPLTRAAPEYPAAAQRAGEQGTVVLQVDVGADGKPGDVSIAQRSGSRDLDRAALEAVRGWSFEPAIRDGEAVRSSVQVPVEFQLDSM